MKTLNINKAKSLHSSFEFFFNNEFVEDFEVTNPDGTKHEKSDRLIELNKIYVNAKKEINEILK